MDEINAIETKLFNKLPKYIQKVTTWLASENVLTMQTIIAISFAR